jgi:hypothetical protein
MKTGVQSESPSFDRRNGDCRPVCVVRLDRIQLAAEPRRPDCRLPVVAEYQCVKDHFVHSQTSIVTYHRTRQLRHVKSGTEVYWQYQPQCSWLKPWKISVEPPDKRGLRIREVFPILRLCRTYHLLLVELALDFFPESGVDRKFVKRHARFGKSRRRVDRGGPRQLRYGTRKSDKLVRCYAKPSLNSYRVELELHSGFLRKHSISSFGDLEKLVTLVCRDHLKFVFVRWKRLRRYLVRKFGDRRGKALLQAARDRSQSLQRVSQFLTRQGVANPHRFLRPMKINKSIRQAMRAWSAGSGACLAD